MLCNGSKRTVEITVLKVKCCLWRWLSYGYASMEWQVGKCKPCQRKYSEVTQDRSSSASKHLKFDFVLCIRPHKATAIWMLNWRSSSFPLSLCDFGVSLCTKRCKRRTCCKSSAKAAIIRVFCCLFFLLLTWPLGGSETCHHQDAAQEPLQPCTPAGAASKVHSPLRRFMQRRGRKLRDTTSKGKYLIFIASSPDREWRVYMDRWEAARSEIVFPGSGVIRAGGQQLMETQRSAANARNVGSELRPAGALSPSLTRTRARERERAGGHARQVL